MSPEINTNNKAAYDPLSRGGRLLDDKTDELIGKMQEGRYDLVLRDVFYPYTDQNTKNVPDHIETGFHEKGRIPLAALDVENNSIEAFYSVIPEYEDETVSQAEKLAESIETVNEVFGTDWDGVLEIESERPAHGVPDHSYDSIVKSTPEGYERIRESGQFAKLSEGLFSGWLEIPAPKLLEK